MVERLDPWSPAKRSVLAPVYDSAHLTAFQACHVLAYGQDRHFEQYRANVEDRLNAGALIDFPGYDDPELTPDALREEMFARSDKGFYMVLMAAGVAYSLRKSAEVLLEAVRRGEVRLIGRPTRPEPQEPEQGREILGAELATCHARLDLQWNTLAIAAPRGHNLPVTVNQDRLDGWALGFVSLAFDRAGVVRLRNAPWHELTSVTGGEAVSPATDRKPWEPGIRELQKSWVHRAEVQAQAKLEADDPTNLNSIAEAMERMAHRVGKGWSLQSIRKRLQGADLG